MRRPGCWASTGGRSTLERSGTSSTSAVVPARSLPTSWSAASGPSASISPRRTRRRAGVFPAATHAGIGQEVVEHDWHGAAEGVLVTYYGADELRAVLARHHFEVVDVRSHRPLEREHAVTKLFITAIATSPGIPGRRPGRGVRTVGNKAVKSRGVPDMNG